MKINSTLSYKNTFDPSIVWIQVNLIHVKEMSYTSLVLLLFLTVFAKNAISENNKVKTGYGYLDKNGKLLFNKTFVAASSFSEGLAVVGQYKKISVITRKMEYYFINRNGDKAIDNYYKAAFGFSEGLAPVVIDDHWGFINKSGQLVIKSKFSLIGNFREGLAFASTKESGGFINTSGDWVIKIPEKKSKFDTAENYEGYYYGDPSHFNEGIAKICYDKFFKHVCYYINKEGKKLFDGKEFGYATDFTDGIAVVGNGSFGNTNRYLIDKTGAKITLALDTNNDVTEVSEGIALVQNFNFSPSFYINLATQKRINKSAFYIAKSFSEGLACVSEGVKTNKVGYINKEGEYAIKPLYIPTLTINRIETCSSFKEGRAAVINKKNRMLFIDLEGNEIIPEYPINYAGHFDNGIINVRFSPDNYPNRKKRRPRH